MKVIYLNLHTVYSGSDIVKPPPRCSTSKSGSGEKGKLGETETTISTLSTAIAKGTAEIETAKEQLQDFVSTLTL